MSIFKRIFEKKSLDQTQSEQTQQAALVHLDSTGIPDHIYDEYDLATIADRVIDTLEREGPGEFDGNEVGPGAFSSTRGWDVVRDARSYQGIDAARRFSRST
jgi:hypothetical protein